MSSASLSSPSAAFPSASPGRAVSFAWILLATASLLLCTVVVCFAWLRETPIFWRNAGGFAIWLRELVLLTFYPLLLGAILLSAVLTRSLVAGWRGSARAWSVHVILVFLCWMLVGATFFIAWSNNILNLIEGRPVHTHQNEEGPG